MYKYTLACFFLCLMGSVVAQNTNSIVDVEVSQRDGSKLIIDSVARYPFRRQFFGSYIKQISEATSFVVAEEDTNTIFGFEVDSNTIFGFEVIQGGSEVITDSGTRYSFKKQFFPKSWTFIKGFGAKVSHIKQISEATGFGRTYNDAYTWGGSLIYNRYLSVGYQEYKFAELVQFDSVYSGNAKIREVILSFQYSVYNTLVLNLNYYTRIGKNLPVSSTAFGLFLGGKF